MKIQLLYCGNFRMIIKLDIIYIMQIYVNVVAILCIGRRMQRWNGCVTATVTGFVSCFSALQFWVVTIHWSVTMQLSLSSFREYSHHLSLYDEFDIEKILVKKFEFRSYNIALFLSYQWVHPNKTIKEYCCLICLLNHWQLYTHIEF